jgi:predicted dehydrogenase
MGGMEPVRWGVLGTSKFAREWIVPGMMKSPDVRVIAVGSRTRAKADSFAKALGIPMAYGSYEDLLNDPNVEAIYNPLPNHLHVPMTIVAMRAGKHVLCEKPIALTAAEAELLRTAPKGPLVAEAFMVRHHPQWHEVRRLIREGATAAESTETAAVDQYQLEAEAFGRAVRGLETLSYGVEDAISNMRVVDALFRSSATNRWEDV